MRKSEPKLTPSVRDALRLLSKGPQPRNKFNPGVNRSLEGRGLVDTVGLLSPYANSKGKLIEHQVINESGKVALSAAGIEQAGSMLHRMHAKRETPHDDA